MADTAQVLIQIRGDVGDINAKLADLRGNIGRVAAQAGSLSTMFRSSFNLIAGAIGGISLYNLVSLGKQVLDDVGALNKMAQSSGVAAEEMMGLNVIAKLTGKEVETIGKAFKFLSQNIVEAQQGGTDAAIALQTLGTTARDTAGAHSQLMERFLQVADRVSKMEDGYVKTAYVTKVFGRAGMELIPILNKGRDELEGMIQKGREWGVILDSEMIGRISAFNAHLKEFGLRAQGAKTQIMAGMLDGLQRLADAYDEVISKGGFWKEFGELLGDAARGVAELLIAMKALFELIGTGFSGLWEVIKGNKTFSALNAELDAIDKKWIAVRERIMLKPLDVKKPERGSVATPPKGSDVDKIQNVIDKLRIEEAQLGKTAMQQAVNNSLKEAGFKIDEKTGEFKGNKAKIAQISELTEKIFRQKQALEILEQVNKRAVDTMNANRTEASAWADQLEDLNDQINSGKITWEAWAIAVSKVNAEMAKTDFTARLASLQKMKNEIAALEIKDETPAVEIASRKKAALQAELDLRQKLLDLMPRLTAEQDAAWNSESEALGRVREQLLEQEQIVRRYQDVWSGARQGVKAYFDEAAAVADQVKKTVQDAFRGMEDALIDFVKTGKLNFSSLVDSIISDLLRLMIRQNITAPLAAGLSKALSGGDLFSFFGGSSGMFFHSGGIVGREGRSFRIGVNPDVLPRFHAGVGPDEQLAVLQKGEGVFTAGQMRALGAALGGGTSISVPVTVEGGNKRLASDLRRNIERAVEDTIRRQM